MKIWIPGPAVLAIALVTLTSCGRRQDAPVGEAAAAAVVDAAPAGEVAGGQAPAGEDAGLSDLDRPVEELFEASCEHGVRMYECDACRYEVGVARAPAALLAQGLLKVGVVGRRAVEAPIALTGVIRFDGRRVASLSPPMESVIRRVLVIPGQRVTKGQPLVEVESIALGETESSYLEAQAALRLARENLDRQETLRRERIAAEKDYLQARQDYEVADIRVTSAVGKLRRLGRTADDLAGLDEHRTPGGTLTLRAPGPGAVLELNAIPGKAAGPTDIVAVIGDPSTVWLVADLHEGDLSRTAGLAGAEDLKALVTVAAYPDREFPGKVVAIDPGMDEATRTLKLRVEIADSGGLLCAGMFAGVRLLPSLREDVTAVSRSSVFSDEGRSFVFLHHHGDYYVRRPVETARVWGEWLEVTAGLSGGETIVTDGGFLLKSDVLRSKMGAGCAD